MTYQLPDYIIYRCYSEECYIWNIKERKAFVFEESASDVLRILEKNGECSSEKIVDGLLELYESVDNELVQEHLKRLSSMGIIQQIDKKDSSQALSRAIVGRLVEKKQLASVVFELTYSCNEKCKHCYVDNEFRNNRQAEMNKREIFAILDQLYESNVAWITFTGGEVFNREDAIEIIEYAARKPFMIDVFSNGTKVSDSIMIRLAQCNLRTYQSSVYGSNASIHDRITGLPGSFRKTVHVLKTLHNLGVQTVMKSSIMEDNFDDYDNLVRLASKIGCVLQVSPSISPTMRGDQSKLHLRIDENKMRKLLFEEKIRKYEDFDDKMCDLTHTNICNAGFFSLNIDPYGDVYLCSNLGKSLGNLKHDNILEIWNHSETVKWWQNSRRSDIKCFADCQYSEECAFCPAQAYLESGDCFNKYDEACIIAKVQKEIEEG